jgi:HK97 family phage major capsid protein
MDRKTMLAQIKAKEQSRDTLLAKGAEIKHDDIQQVKTLNDEIKGLQDLVDQMDSMKSWGEEPATRPTLPGATKQNEVLGFLHSGYDEFEFLKSADQNSVKRSLKMLGQQGEGIFGAKAWAAISTKAYHDGFWKYIHKGERMLGSGELKDLSEGLDTQGGYLAPPELIARILGRLPAPNRVAGLVTNITSSRDAVQMPRVNYAADDIWSTAFRVAWTGETPGSDTEHAVNDDDFFGSERIDVHTAMMSTSLTNDLLDDSGFDLQGFIVGKLGETSDTMSDQVAVVGTGVSQPFGMMTDVARGRIAEVVSGNSSALTADGLIDLDYALPEQYLASGSLAYVMNRTNTARAIAKLKDAQNRYLFAMGMPEDGGLQGARPDSLLGKNIAYSPFLSNVAANANPIIYGDLSGYVRVQRLGLTIQVLRETGAKRNKVELVARVRLGGKTVEPWKLKAQKVST